MPTAGSAGSVPENLNLFPEPGSKSEETGKKQLSKDSILSLYGSQTPQMPTQGKVREVMEVLQGKTENNTHECVRIVFIKKMKFVSNGQNWKILC